MKSLIYAIIFGVIGGTICANAMHPVKPEIKTFQILEEANVRASLNGKVVILTLKKGTVVSVYAQNVQENRKNDSNTNTDSKEAVAVKKSY